MKIATYNVNGITGRLPVLLRWLEEEQPDIVCLQELRAPQEKFPEEALQAAGYAAIWHGQKSWNGVVFFLAVQRRPKLDAAFPAIPRTRIAATSKRKSGMSSSAAS